jgi:uncharacterized caspase-like protein
MQPIPSLSRPFQLAGAGRPRAISFALLFSLLASISAGAGVIDDSPRTPLDQFRYPPVNVYVLAIGISNYHNHNYDLWGGLQDAAGVQTASRQVLNALPPNTIALTDAAAIKANIRTAIQQFALKSQANDLFIFSFSGHTIIKTRNGIQESYLVPSDVTIPDECTDTDCAIDESSLISGALLNSWMTQMHAKRQIVLLEASNSDRLIPICEDHWRKESYSVGPDASKRLLVVTNHGEGWEDMKHGSVLTYAFTGQLQLLDTAFHLQQALYEVLDPEANNNAPPDLKDIAGSRVQFRAELLGGDFLIEGSQEIKRADLVRESGAGALCHYDANGTSRGISPIDDDSKDNIAVPSSQPTNYALVIASDHYKSWPVLSNPIFDATTIEKDLTSLYGFKVEHLWDPTRDQLRQKLDELHARKFNDQDQLFIFIAGHGDYDETNDIGYLVFPETPLGHVYDSEMNLQELRQRIDTIHAKHIFLVMDSCFAGSLDPSLGGMGRGDYDPIPLEKLRQRTADKETRYFLTSGGKEYVPDGTPGNHSPFASLFILALGKSPKSPGYLNLSQMPHYFERLGTVPRAGSLGHNQDGADFFFVPLEISSRPEQ